MASKIQDIVLQNLAEAVSSSSLVLQVQLLSLLQAIVTLDSYSFDKNTSESSESVKDSPMFLQTLIAGLLQSSSKNIRFYWLEFITACLPHFKGNLSFILPQIIKCICR